jgi:hypothetical protein
MCIYICVYTYMCMCVYMYMCISSLVWLVFMCIYMYIHRNVICVVFYFFSGLQHHALQFLNKVESNVCKSESFEAEEEDGHLFKQILHNT